jgi:hypothetical protein
MFLLAASMPSEGEGSSLKATVLGTLEQHAGHEADPSLAVAATFGEFLGQIFSFAPDWYESQADVLLGALVSDDLGARSWSDCVFSVALRSYYPSPQLLEILRPWLSTALSDKYSGVGHVEGWKFGSDRTTPQEVGRHVISAFLGGHVALNDVLVEGLFRPRGGNLAAKTIGLVGWSAMRADYSDDELTRARELVDWRLAEVSAGRADLNELSEFYWWVRSGRFEPDWWLPILRQILTHDDFDMDGMIGDALEAASRSYPRESLEIVELILKRRTERRAYQVLRTSPPVILAALTSGLPDVVSRAEALLNRLGREGFVELVASVERDRRMQGPGPNDVNPD